MTVFEVITLKRRRIAPRLTKIIHLIGVRGSLSLSVKLEFADNEARFREITGGVKFFSSVYQPIPLFVIPPLIPPLS